MSTEDPTDRPQTDAEAAARTRRALDLTRASRVAPNPRIGAQIADLYDEIQAAKGTGPQGRPDDALGQALTDVEARMAAARDRIVNTVASGRAPAQPGAYELRDAAVDRYRRDHVAHMRAELATRVVDTVVELVEVPVADDDGTIGTGRVRELDDLELARLGAAIALELVERDKPTAEAKLERVRALAEVWLKGTPREVPRSALDAARLLLDVLGDPA